MNDFTLKTSRGQMLASMLKKPETAKLLKEALGSPLGSTSRIKARKIFSIMSKLHAHNEGNGMGGPGYDPAVAFGTAPAQAPEISAKGMVMFNRIPKSKITYGKPIVKSQSQLLSQMNTFNRPKQALSFDVNNIFRPSTPTASPVGQASASLSGVGGPGTQDGRGGIWDWTKKNIVEPVGNKISVINNFTEKPDKWLLDKILNSSFTSGIYKGFTDPKPTSSPRLPTKPIQPPEKTNSSGSPIGNKISSGLDALKNLGGFLKNKNIIAETFNKPSAPASTPGTSTFIGPRAPQAPALVPANPYTGAANPYSSRATGTPSTQLMSSMSNITPSAETFNKVGTSGTPKTGGFTGIRAVDESGTLTGGTKYTFKIGDHGGQCAAFVHDVTGVPAGGNSKQSKLDLIDASITTPREGLVAVFGGAEYGTYGHVAIVHSVNPDGSLVIIDSNAKGGDDETIRMYTIPASVVTGYYDPNSDMSGRVRYYPKSDLQNAVENQTGPLSFAGDQTRASLGGTYSDLLRRNQKEAEDKYGIMKQRSDVAQWRLENSTIGQDTTNYIRGRDSALDEYDKAIDKVLREAGSTMDMSNPDNASKVNSQLNYLYTLRGRQNQSYIGYLNSAVEQHTAQMNSRIATLTEDLKMYDNYLTNLNAGTTAEYDAKMKEYEDAYNALDGAELKKYTLEKARQDLYGAQNAADNLTDAERLAHANLLQERMQEFDSAKTIPAGFNLQQTIDTARANPGLTGVGEEEIIGEYVLATKRYLDLKEEDDPSKGSGVTAESKLARIKEAVEQLRNVANGYGTKGFTDVEARVNAYADDISETGVTRTGESFTRTGQMPQVMEAIKTFNTARWYNWGEKPPSQEEFVKTFTEKVAQSATLDQAIAKAIYAAYMKYYRDKGENKNAMIEAVAEFLSYKDKEGKVIPITESTMGQHLATILALGFK